MPEIQPSALPVSRFVPLALLVAAGTLFIMLGGEHYVTFATLADNREWLREIVARGGAGAAIGFVLVYAGLVALSVPGAALLTVTSGLLFGPWFGTLYAVTGATLGATVVFFAARLGLAGLSKRAGPRVRRLEAGFRDDALSYLLVLRLMPLVPFWLVNLVAGAAGLRAKVYILATFVGMIPTSFVYASLGSGLGDVLTHGHPPDGTVFLEPELLLPLIGLVALALLPIAYKYWRGRGGKEAA